MLLFCYGSVLTESQKLLYQSLVELASHGHQVKAYDVNAWQRETLQRRIDEIGLQLERDGLLESGFKLHVSTVSSLLSFRVVK